MYRTEKIFILKNYLFFFVSLYYTVNSVSGQISPVYQKYYSYEYAINPAISGRDYYPIVNFSHFKSWVGTDYSPSSSCFGFTLRLGNYGFYTPKMLLNKTGISSKARMGIGGFTMVDKNGPLNFFCSTLSYAYFVPFKTIQSELSFGLSFKLSQFTVDESLLDPLDPGDPLLLSIDDGKLRPESDFGIYFHNPQFNIGMSIDDLLQIDYSINSTRNIQSKRDLFFQSSYKIFLTRMELEPGFFAGQIDDLPLYYDISLKLYYLNFNWISVAYRSSESLWTGFGFKINKIHVAYAYTQNLTKIANYFSGSHEIMIGTNLGLKEAEGIRKLGK